MKYPDNNPKSASGMTKVPLHLVPPSAEYFLALALADGARKYGPYNWREAAISTSVYVAACKRHIAAFWDGETLAADSGVHHLAHAMACIALMLDAMSVGKLHDDRPPAGNVVGVIKERHGNVFDQLITGRKVATIEIARVVDDNFWRARLGPHPRERCGDRLLTADVEFDDHAFAAAGQDGLCKGGRIVLVACR